MSLTVVLAFLDIIWEDRKREREAIERAKDRVRSKRNPKDIFTHGDNDFAGVDLRDADSSTIKKSLADRFGGLFRIGGS